MRKKELKSRKGITLIALVVTIVVLLILAGITINLVFSENGIIKKAQDAAEAQKQAEESDKEALEGLGAQVDALTKGWNTSKVTAVKSKDTTPVTVPVPKGFTVSGLSTENTVAGGFVIYEGTFNIDWTDSEKVKEAQETRNQFVWVPVDLNKKPMFTTATDEDGNSITVGQLYDFGYISSPKNPPEKITYSSTVYREPDVVSYDANSTYLSILGLSSRDEFKTQLQKEFNEMKISVETYGGFYIGRYETGNLVATKDTPAKVVKNDTKIGDVNWYYQYQNSKSIVQNEEAKAVGIKSSMIWGSQWDATLNWFLSFKETKPEVATYVTDSREKGNYKGTQGDTNKAIPTGSNDDYAVQNIYDMAGNVYDWTLEASNTIIRNVRRRLFHPFRFR